MRHEQQTAAGVKTGVVEPELPPGNRIRATTRNPGVGEDGDAECAGLLAGAPHPAVITTRAATTPRRLTGPP